LKVISKSSKTPQGQSQTKKDSSNIRSNEEEEPIKNHRELPGPEALPQQDLPPPLEFPDVLCLVQQVDRTG
jgi:hypothetical protein